MEERYAPDHTFKLGDTISIYREHSQKISLRLIRTNTLEIGFLYKEVELFFFKGMKVDNTQEIPARKIHNWLKGKQGRYELKLLEEEPPYKVGDRFILEYNDDEYLLAQVGSRTMGLIGLADGNRFEKPVKVVDPRAITQEEFKEMTRGFKFTKKEKGNE